MDDNFDDDEIAPDDFFQPLLLAPLNIGAIIDNGPVDPWPPMPSVGITQEITTYTGPAFLA